MITGSKIKDLAGNKYYRLTVIRFVEKRKNNMSCWLCLCECGKETIVQLSNLKNGHTKSCGCLAAENAKKHSLTHGHTANNHVSPEYKAWSGAKQRCFYKKSNHYYLYGARGITMHERWKNSFVNFLADLGPKPVGYFLERINNNGNYEPGNCRWASDFEQRINKRTNRILQFNGKTLTAVEWDIACGFVRGTVKSRFHKGWAIERIMTTPVKSRPR